MTTKEGIFMARTTVQFRMDSDLKQRLEKIFKEMGLNMTTAMNLFANAVVNQGKIPFDITAPKSQLESDLEDVCACRRTASDTRIPRSPAQERLGRFLRLPYRA